MRVFRGFHHRDIAPQCALTIGNFDGVHRGHQAMLALLQSEARHRGLPSCVLTFEPHPRDFFATRLGKPELAPARIATLRDKLGELERCGIDQVVILRFDEALCSLPAQAFIDQVLQQGLGARYVLVGDDFRFGAKRQGDYATLDAAGQQRGFDVARMMSYEVHGLRVSSSAVREALAAGDMDAAARLLGRGYAISGHVVHGAKLGRSLSFPTLNLRFDEALASLPAQDFIGQVLQQGLGARYVLVGDDFRFGAKRQGDYATLDAAGQQRGFDVARMMSYEVHGLRVSSSAVREALAVGDMDAAARLLGRPYAISGHVVHGAKLGRTLNFPTLNLRFEHDKPAAKGIFAVRVHGLADRPLDGAASLGVRPTVEDAGRVLLEVHCLEWPAELGSEGAYGKLVRVELLHKLRDEARFDGLPALTAAIRQDVEDARAYLATHAAMRRQTTRDRI